MANQVDPPSTVQSLAVLCVSVCVFDIPRHLIAFEFAKMGRRVCVCVCGTNKAVDSFGIFITAPKNRSDPSPGSFIHDFCIMFLIKTRLAVAPRKGFVFFIQEERRGGRNPPTHTHTSNQSCSNGNRFSFPFQLCWFLRRCA